MRKIDVSTTGSSPETGSEVAEALREAASAIDVAQTMLSQGNIVDLEGLETHVEEACSAIPGLPVADREELKPTLVALIDGLNLLSDRLSAQHEEISGTLQNIGTRHRAVSAYKPRDPR